MQLVGTMEKWRKEKYICLVENKNKIIKNKTSIKLQVCPY